MSLSAHALGRRRGGRAMWTRAVAAFLTLALIAALGAAVVSLSDAPADRRVTDDAAVEAVEPGMADPSEILAATTASPAIDTAIQRLIDGERFRFELRMRPTSGKAEMAWRVTGEADIATALNDPSRLHAQVALGSGETYSVLTDQLRIGDALYERDPETGAYAPTGANGSDELGAVDPVSTILASLSALPATHFEERVSADGDKKVLVRAGGHKLEGDITAMTVLLDGTGALQSMRFRSKAMTSRVTVWDLGDPSIEISAPSPN